MYLSVQCEKWGTSDWDEGVIWVENYWATADQSITVRGDLVAWGRFVPTVKSNKEQKIVWGKPGQENFRTTVLNIEKLKKLNMRIKGWKETY